MRERISIFVAGASSERLAVRSVIDKVIEWGHTVTYDWTRSPCWDVPMTPEISAEVSRLNKEGVRAAVGVLVVASEGHPSLGAHYEVGLAEGLGKPVIAIHRGVVPLEWIHVNSCNNGPYLEWCLGWLAHEAKTKATPP